MKHLVVLIYFIAIANFCVYAQPIDSATAKNMMDNGVALVVKAIEQKTGTLKDTTAPVLANAPQQKIGPAKGMVCVLSLLPIILFIIIIWAVGIKLRNEGAKLSYFLLDKETINAMDARKAEVEKVRLNAIAKNPAAFAALAAPLIPAPADDEPAKREDQSISRLIVYLTGLTTLALACCITSFYFYRTFNGDPKPDLSNLSTILYGLGLGIIPYGFTKIANALKPNT